jgi:hypothetical protein
MKFAHYCLPALLLVTSGGCVAVKDCVDNCVIDCRNRCYAEKAWLSCKSCYNDVECKCDFGKGFKDGYVAVASGGSTCQPAMPPRRYWHFQYQNPDGQERMLAWFNGYSYGAIYAEQEGISDWSRVVTAPTLPPYRKRRPSKSPSMTDSAAPYRDSDAMPYGLPTPVPYVEPAPADDSVDAPSASAGMIELDNPSQESGSPANAAVVRWTDAAEGY